MRKKTFKKDVFVNARESAGLSQAALAKKIGCSETDIYRYEAGITYPRNRRLGKLVEILGPSILSEPETPDDPLSVLGQFTEEERQFLDYFEALPYPRKCMVLGHCWTYTAYGRSADVDFAAELSGHLAVELQRQQGQSEQHEA